jgi:hypothetical protein
VKRWMVAIVAAVAVAAALSAAAANGAFQAATSPSPSSTTTTTGRSARTTTTTTAPPTTAPSTAPSSVRTSVLPCPVPARDYAGTPYGQQSPPGTLEVASSLAPPDGASLFGSVIAGGPPSYLVAPSGASCQGSFGSADAGMTMSATVGIDVSQGVKMVLRAGGANAYSSLACPYIPAVQAAEEAFSGSGYRPSYCIRPSADVVEQIATGTANVYLAAVWVPPQVTDTKLGMSGKGDPTFALFSAEVTSPASADGRMIACTLPSKEQRICEASLVFFLVDQSGIATQVGTGSLGRMGDAVTAFVDQH